MFQKGILLIISGPSGAGKGCVIKLLRKQNENLKKSISATTRLPREGETDGVNYYFKTIDEFKIMIEQNELLEWVQYCGNYYGTPRKFIEDSIQEGTDVVMEMEVEGALNVKQKFPECVITFMLPPSYDELKKRIVGRGTEDEGTIAKRLQRAKEEVACAERYDYLVVNDVLQQAVDDVNRILTSERMRPRRNLDALRRIIGYY